jgi:Trk K+ transport system NAD-binding subunit
LVLGGVQVNSPYIGEYLNDVFPTSQKEKVDVLAIFREGHTILPGNQNVILRVADRLLMIVDQTEWKRIRSNFSLYKPKERIRVESN